MSTVKVSVTLDAARVEEAKRLVGERQFSRFVDEAVALRLQRMRLARLETELEAEHGPIPDAAMREVEAIEWPR